VPPTTAPATGVPVDHAGFSATFSLPSGFRVIDPTTIDAAELAGLLASAFPQVGSNAGALVGLIMSGQVMLATGPSAVVLALQQPLGQPTPDLLQSQLDALGATDVIVQVPSVAGRPAVEAEFTLMPAGGPTEHGVALVIDVGNGEDMLIVATSLSPVTSRQIMDTIESSFALRS
jgi:hypothetical protein